MISAFGVQHEEISKAKLPVFHGTTKAGAKAIKQGKFVSGVGRKRKGSIEDVASQPHSDFRPEGIYTTADRSYADMYAASGRVPNKNTGFIGSLPKNPYKGKGRVLRWNAKGKHPLYTDRESEIVFDPKDLGKPKVKRSRGLAVKAKAGGKKYALVPERRSVRVLPRKKFERAWADVASGNGKWGKKSKKRAARAGKKMEGMSQKVKVTSSGKIKAPKDLHPKVRQQAVDLINRTAENPRIKRVYRSAAKAVTPEMDKTFATAFGVNGTGIMKGLPSALRGEAGMALIQRHIAANGKAARKATVKSLVRSGEGGGHDWKLGMRDALRDIHRKQDSDTAYMLSRRIRNDRGRQAAALTNKQRKKKWEGPVQAGKGAKEYETDRGFVPAEPAEIPFRRKVIMNMVEHRRFNPSAYGSALKS